MKTAIKTYSQRLLIQGDSHRVFSFMDDLAKTGMHMTKPSMMMMGSKLTLEDITKSGTGIGSTKRSATRWCINNMLQDTKALVENQHASKNPTDR